MTTRLRPWLEPADGRKRPRTLESAVNVTHPRDLDRAALRFRDDSEFSRLTDGVGSSAPGDTARSTGRCASSKPDDSAQIQLETSVSRAAETP